MSKSATLPIRIFIRPARSIPGYRIEDHFFTAGEHGAGIWKAAQKALDSLARRKEAWDPVLGVVIFAMVETEERGRICVLQIPAGSPPHRLGLKEAFFASAPAEARVDTVEEAFARLHPAWRPR